MSLFTPRHMRRQPPHRPQDWRPENRRPTLAEVPPALPEIPEHVEARVNYPVQSSPGQMAEAARFLAADYAALESRIVAATMPSDGSASFESALMRIGQRMSAGLEARLLRAGVEAAPGREPQEYQTVRFLPDEGHRDRFYNIQDGARSGRITTVRPDSTVERVVAESQAAELPALPNMQELIGRMFREHGEAERLRVGAGMAYSGPSLTGRVGYTPRWEARPSQTVPLMQTRKDATGSVRLSVDINMGHGVDFDALNEALDAVPKGNPVAFAEALLAVISAAVTPPPKTERVDLLAPSRNREIDV